MKIEIEIPKEFENDYVANRFEDFFRRMLAEIQYGDLCDEYEYEIAEMLFKAFKSSKIKNHDLADAHK